MGCIYKITCSENGKCYIGQSKKDNPVPRYTRHWNDAIKRNTDTPLYRAFRKYEKNNFNIEVLCIVPNESLNNMECYFAEQYESYVWENGYNAVLCGKGRAPNFNHKQEHRDLVSKLMKGKKMSDETKKKLSDSKKGKPCNWNEVTRSNVAEKCRLANTGRKHTEETKAKVSAASRGRKFSDEVKQKLSVIHRERLKDPKAYTRKGIPHTEETKKHLSDIHRKRYLENPNANRCSKFTDEQIRQIRLNPDKLTQKQLGEHYGMSFQNISNIQLRKTYKHVL